MVNAFVFPGKFERPIGRAPRLPHCESSCRALAHCNRSYQAGSTKWLLRRV